jgi:ABC-type transport system substrate-binding protein/DNA-binding beta-propeller fold protein YncE
MALAIPTLGGADLRPTPATTATLAPNSVSEVDDAGHVLATVAVGTNPIAMASSHGALWVVNAGDDTVWKVDPSSHTVGQKIKVDPDPRGVAATGDDLWITSFASGTVTRINLLLEQVVQTLHVGSNPDAIAAGRAGLWVANSGDNTIQRIDPDSGSVQPPIDVGDGPDGLAVDDTSVWVANGRGASVMRIDARTGTPMSHPIQVGTGPRGIVRVGPGVWVTDELSQDVFRIDAATYRTRSVPVGDGPTALAAHDGALLVAEKDAGDVVRIATDTGESGATGLHGAAQAIAVAGGRAWVAAGAARAAAHRGGTLRVAAVSLPGTYGGIDPASVYEWVTLQAERDVYDTLLAYHYSSADPQVLLPDLATSVPAPLDGGRTYVFNLRPGIRYSTGRAVVASDFVRGVQRALHSRIARPDFYAGILGGRHCIRHPRSCDLSRGVVADDAAGVVTFHLRAPDPQFLLKLTLLVVPTPPGTPVGDLKEPLPATGPYRIADYVAHRSFRLERNEYFREWSAGAQPDGFVDRVVWLAFADVRTAARAVEDGAADLVDFNALGESGPEIGRLVDHYRVTAPSRMHGNVVQGTGFVVVNTAVPPFADVRARQAFSDAVDRNRIVQIEGGSSFSEPTCQLIPPSMPSYVRYCPYTPGRPDGPYSGPDLAEARRLVEASGTSGMTVRVTDITGDINETPWVDYLVRVLRRIGYRASLQRLPDNTRTEHYYMDPTSGVQVETGGWFADFPVPSNFFDLVTCGGGGGYAVGYCDHALDRRIARATAQLQVDPAAAQRTFTTIDREVTDRAVLVPVSNLRSWWLSSRRVGNYQNDIRDYGPLTSLLWVR